MLLRDQHSKGPSRLSGHARCAVKDIRLVEHARCRFTHYGGSQKPAKDLSRFL
jgi:hypothetical protein